MTRTPRSFVVYGTPQPQGSAKAFVVGGKARITTDNAKLKPWRQQVAQVALLEFRGEMLEGAIDLQVTFYFEKPKSAKNRVYPTVKPDKDKLLRALNDALTGIAFKDDSQVCNTCAAKRYGSPARTEITVGEMA